MHDTTKIYLKEGRDFRYSIIKEEGGNQEQVDECDRIAAESLALEAQQAGFEVHWIYPEDSFSPYKSMIRLSL